MRELSFNELNALNLEDQADPHFFATDTPSDKGYEEIYDTLQAANRQYVSDGRCGNYLESFLQGYGNYLARPILFSSGTPAFAGRGIRFADPDLESGELSAWIPYVLGYPDLESLSSDLEAAYRLGVNPLPTLRQRLDDLKVIVQFGIMNADGHYLARPRSATLVVRLDDETGQVGLEIIDYYAEDDFWYQIRAFSLDELMPR